MNVFIIGVILLFCSSPDALELVNKNSEITSVGNEALWHTNDDHGYNSVGVGNPMNSTVYMTVNNYYCTVEEVKDPILIIYGTKSWTFPTQDVNLTLSYPAANTHKQTALIIIGLIGLIVAPWLHRITYRNTAMPFGDTSCVKFELKLDNSGLNFKLLLNCSSLIIQDQSIFQSESNSSSEEDDYLITGFKVILTTDGVETRGYISDGGVLEESIVLSFVSRGVSTLSYKFWLYGLTKHNAGLHIELNTIYYTHMCP